MRNSENVVFRIEPQQRDLLSAAAQQSGETLSSWARKTLVDVARATLEHRDSGRDEAA